VQPVPVVPYVEYDLPSPDQRGLREMGLKLVWVGPSRRLHFHSPRLEVLVGVGVPLGELGQCRCPDQAHKESRLLFPNMEHLIERVKHLSSHTSWAGSYLRDMFGMRVRPSSTYDIRGAFGPFVGGGHGLSDAEIRAALPVDFTALPMGERLVLEEVECWRGYVRADYLCVSDDGALSVIEVKSDRDTLRRFHEQVRVYSAIADRVILVVGWNLAARALRAAPLWWDVLLAERGLESRVRFVPLRDGSSNPGVAADALAAMLPMDDVRHLARGRGLSPGRLSGRRLRDLIATHVSNVELRAAVGRWLTRLAQERELRPSP